MKGLYRLRAGALLFGSPLRQLVAAVVVLVRSVSLRPGPQGCVFLRERVEFLPEILVDHRLLLRRNPAAPLPVLDPACNAVLHLLGIGDDLHFAGLLQRLQPLDGRHQFHAVVRGVGRTPPHLPFALVVTEDAGPSSGTGVAFAGAVGNQFYFFHWMQGSAKKSSTRPKISPAS